MKACNKCKVEKPLDLFKQDPRNKDGKQGICYECAKERDRIKRAQRQLDKPKVEGGKVCTTCKKYKDYFEFYKDSSFSDGHRSNCKKCKDKHTLAWRDKNRDKYNKNMRDFRANNKELTKNVDLLRTHNITLEQYNQMLVAQDYKCKICKKENTSKKRSFAVDHNHDTGHIRALLCYGCNRALHALETKDLFKKAQDYLNEFSDPTGRPISKNRKGTG